MNKQTTQSEYGPIQSIYVKKAEHAFVSQQNLDKQFKTLNYLGSPNYNTSQIEYDQFLKIIADHISEVHYFSENESVGIDSIYCRDASIATDHGMILCNMGKPLRMTEPEAQQQDFHANGQKVLGQITGDARIEGGDVAWLDTSTLAVAHGYRTNQAGFEQLSALLSPFDINCIQVDLPHYKGKSDVFHLMSIFSPVDKDKAVVYSPLMPVRFRDLLLDRDYQLIEVPDEEYESMGCNVLALAPSKCLMVSGNAVIHQRLVDANCEVIEYDGQEISVKGGGGPTCLTRPIIRIQQ